MAHGVGVLDRYPSLRYVGPFAVFAVLLVAGPRLPIGPPWESIGRVVVLAAVTWFFARRVPEWAPPRQAVASTLVGLAVFALWIAPDLLFPGYRRGPLFQNSLTGTLASSLPAEALRSPLVLALRTARAALLVPVIEELFWRAWLPRFVQNADFRRVPLGRYTPLAFWATALLFASEHGPFWDVGLAAGAAYNWWMWRTRSLSDLVLAHAVTNAALCAYVLATGRWEYWL
ncbi:MAG TPA: CAAX prenyl protease-related protein [Gemmatimonadaceae bacterium]|nr:CAAX prenyl protease-related protein [Gemmatimonadaceae bacterium]